MYQEFESKMNLESKEKKVVRLNSRGEKVLEYQKENMASDVLLCDEHIISVYTVLNIVYEQKEVNLPLGELFREFGLSLNSSWRILKALQELGVLKKKKVRPNKKFRFPVVWKWSTKRIPDLELSYEALKFTQKYPQ